MRIAVLNRYRYRKEPNDVVVSTTSNSEGKWQLLSPFILGPCQLYKGNRSLNMENAWQFSKVYKRHTNEWGDPTFAYFDWARRGWGDHRAHRYPMGKGAIPEYSWWDGTKLDYINARKRIYAPLYARAVQRTVAFRELKRLYNECKREKKRLVLLDYDAYDHRELKMTLTDVLNFKDKKMGHAFVLMMLLKKDKALDQIGFIK